MLMQKVVDRNLCQRMRLCVSGKVGSNWSIMQCVYYIFHCTSAHTPKSAHPFKENWKLSAPRCNLFSRRLYSFVKIYNVYGDYFAAILYLFHWYKHSYLYQYQQKIIKNILFLCRFIYKHCSRLHKTVE